jgi:hypothetical protein
MYYFTLSLKMDNESYKYYNKICIGYNHKCSLPQTLVYQFLDSEKEVKWGHGNGSGVVMVCTLDDPWFKP